MNDFTSPKREQRKLIPPVTPPQWKKPDDVMRRLRLKRNALAARINGTDVASESKPISPKPSLKSAGKRKNPFRRVETTTSPVSKKVKETAQEEKNDASLFQLLGLNETASIGRDFSFLNAEFPTDDENVPEQQTNNGFKDLPIDWALKTKLRFISVRQFPWTETLKTSEEASGITGFVRCVESGRGGSPQIDTSPNAMFHQCCMYWQHPNLSWIDMFPRKRPRTYEHGTTPVLTAYPQIKESMQRDWSESFRSLFQLVRARHCPYFYMVANSFNGVFRAAGVNGCTETTAIVCPTTGGFRKLLTDDGVEFSMPLRVKAKRTSSELAGLQKSENGKDDDEDDDEDPSAWLARLGVDEENIKKINQAQENMEFRLEKTVDGQEESLVYVEGSEVHALFNFLLNFRGLASSTGPYTGIPPTLLSPVAFCGGSLMSYKVRHSNVKLDEESYHSIEIIGPLMPHSVHNLCYLLEDSVDSFSVTFSNLDSTKAFTTATMPKKDAKEEGSPGKVGKSGQAFSIESLCDSGLKPRVLASICSEEIQPFDCLKYTKDLYICS